MVFRLTVGLVNGQLVVKQPFDIGRIVGFIIVNIIADLLDFGILCGIDLETTAVYEVISLCFIVAELIHQILNDLVDHCIDKVGVDRFNILAFIDSLDTGIYIIIDCRVVFALCDIALFEHVV